MSWSTPTGSPGRHRWRGQYLLDHHLALRRRFEYGPTTNYGEVATEDCNRLVHRARLTALEPGRTYHGRGVGIAPDGSEYYGPDIEFTADGADPPLTREGVTQVPLVVRNRHDVDAVAWPVTSGVPFPQGVLGNEGNLRLLGPDGEVTAQFAAGRLAGRLACGCWSACLPTCPRAVARTPSSDAK